MIVSGKYSVDILNSQEALPASELSAPLAVSPKESDAIGSATEWSSTEETENECCVKSGNFNQNNLVEISPIFGSDEKELRPEHELSLQPLTENTQNVEECTSPSAELEALKDCIKGEDIIKEEIIKEESIEENDVVKTEDCMEPEEVMPEFHALGDDIIQGSF